MYINFIILCRKEITYLSFKLNAQLQLRTPYLTLPLGSNSNAKLMVFWNIGIRHMLKRDYLKIADPMLIVNVHQVATIMLPSPQ